MKLPIHLPFKKQNDKQYYLSLLLSDEKLHATIFAENNGKIEVIGEKETHIPVPLEAVPEEQLLDYLDKTISAAETSLPDNFETRKTIFGVKDTWIEDTKIKKEYLTKLKKVCDALGLTPIGFLVIHEAIAHLLQNQEGAPVSAILVEHGTHELAISILRAGKLLETKRVPVEASIPHTIDKALLHFTNYEILPSRLILFGGKAHEKLSQELISHQWSKTIPFLHVPQIKVLPTVFEAKSLLFGAASQMGFEVIDKFDMPTIPSEGENFTVVANNDDEKQTHHEEKAADDTFGFVEEKDVATDKKEHEEDSDDKDEIKEDEDEANGDEGEEDEEVEAFNQEFFAAEHEADSPTRKKSAVALQKLQHTLAASLVKIKPLFAKIPAPAFLAKFPIMKQNKWLIFIPPTVIGLLLFFFISYIFFLKATVVIQIDPKTIEKTQDITFSTKQATDTSQSIIAAQSVSVDEQGSAQTPATGKKEVGDKAKGSVTIYSRISQSKTFSAGTVLSGPNGLKFTLDKDVSVASSSGDASASPATANGSVTASDIGKESNLPSGSKFTIAGFSEGDVVAKNSDAFSGGSKQEITIVAKADIAKITDTVPKQLEEKAKGDLQAKLDSGKSLLPLILGTTIDKKTFSKNVGDEASSVSVDATVSFDSAAFSKSEVDSFALTILSSENSDLSPSKNSVSYTLSDITEKNGDISATIHIKGFLLPKIDKNSIAQQIAGKSFTDAKETMKKLPQVKDADITLHPPLPFFPSLLPRLSKNITVEVATNE